MIEILIAVLSLSSGTYYLSSLSLGPRARVRFDTSDGPVRLFIRTTFLFKGAFEDSTGRLDRIFVGYYGTSGVSLEAPFLNPGSIDEYDFPTSSATDQT